MPGFWRRHRVAAAALVISALFSAASVVLDALQVGYDPLGMALNALVMVAVGFPFLWALLHAHLRVAAWWRSRHPVPSVAPSQVGGEGEEAPPFHWSGRPARRPWTFAGFLATFVLLGALALYGQPLWTAAFNLTLGLFVMVVGMILLAIVYAYRRRSVVVDETGIHVTRGMRSDVHARWSELKEIGIVKFPLSDFLGPFSAREPPKMILLRAQDGTAIGMVQPEMDVAPKFSAALESALRAHARAHTVAVRTVDYREMMTWRRPKKRPVAGGGGP